MKRNNNYVMPCMMMFLAVVNANSQSTLFYDEGGNPGWGNATAWGLVDGMFD